MVGSGPETRPFGRFSPDGPLWLAKATRKIIDLHGTQLAGLWSMASTRNRPRPYESRKPISRIDL
jgi:hypothetical protein